MLAKGAAAVIFLWLVSGLLQAPSSFLAVQTADALTGYDAVSESHTSTTGSASQASFTWNHTPVGTPRGVLVFVNTIGSTDLATSVTYGGVSMTRVTGAEANDTATEPGTVSTWFLGSSIPTGTQAVVVNRTNNATVMYAVAITMTGNSDTEIVGTPALQEENAAATTQAVDAGSRTARRFAAGYYGGAGVLTAGAGSVSTGASGQIDYGNFTFTTAYEGYGGGGSRKVGFNNASDDLASVHVAVADTDTGTIGYDAVSESGTGTTGTSSTSFFNWNHTPVNTPRGVLVFVNTIGSTDLATSVTYGGVSMTEVPNSTATDSTTEPGTVSTWFLGSSIPTGTQAVVVNRTNNATVMYAVAMTMTTEDSDTEVVGTPVLLQPDGAYSVQAVDSGSVVALRFAGAYYGGAAVLSAGTGSATAGASGQIDFGNFTFTSGFETSPGSGSRNVGFTNGTSDDRAAVHLAIAEVQDEEEEPPSAAPARLIRIFQGFKIRLNSGKIIIYGD